MSNVNTINSVETVNTNIEGTENNMDTTTENNLLNEQGHSLEGTNIGTTEVEATETTELTQEEMFLAEVDPHFSATPAQVVAAYPNTVYGATMAAAEQKYRAKYPHLCFKLGSFKQNPESAPHHLYKNKVRGEIMCPSSVNTFNLIWVERATSDIHTFKGCPAHKKAVSKVEKAQRIIAKSAE